jgi:hypothetical protein
MRKWGTTRYINVSVAKSVRPKTFSVGFFGLFLKKFSTDASYWGAHGDHNDFETNDKIDNGESHYGGCRKIGLRKRSIHFGD